MSVFVLLAGVSLAAFIFAATLWSIAQTVRQRGMRRYAHLAAASLAILVMWLSTVSEAYAKSVSWGLLAAALAVLLLETGWSRILPVFLILLAAVMLLGLPFSAE